MHVGEAGRQSDSGIFTYCQFGTALEEGLLNIPPDKALTGISLSVYLLNILGTSEPSLPYVIIGDEGFPLKKYLLRPYPGRYLSKEKSIFYYRLSRARRIIENSFGILAARYGNKIIIMNEIYALYRCRIFRRPIIANPDHAVSFSKAAIVLHHYLNKTEKSTYCPPGYIDGEDAAGNIIQGSWRNNETEETAILPLGQTSSNRPVHLINNNHMLALCLVSRHSRDAADIRDMYCAFFNSEVGEVSWQEYQVQRTI